jgi:polyhydroxyalkanoic acid synthase PhaR subunit
MTNPGAAPPPDPFQLWRDWLSQSERQWNEFFNNMMSTDEYGQAMGRMMDAYLTTQRSMSEAMGRYFTALNVPTRTDVLTLGNRLSDIEDRLAAIETGIARLGPDAAKPKTQARPKPARTKKPPSD